jgi:hypothetical protein
MALAEWLPIVVGVGGRTIRDGVGGGEGVDNISGSGAAVEVR